MKILITGSNGFLGYRLQKYLDETYEVYAMSHQNMDITKLDEIYSVFQRVNPDIVIHCAAIADTKLCETQHEFAYGVNVTGTINVSKACNVFQAKLIFCSSDQVYHNTTELGGHSETENLEPTKMYARYKYEAEQVALSIHQNTVCLRLTAMYDFRYDIKREHNNLLSYVLRDIEARNYMRYAKNEYRGFTYVGDVIQNIPKVFTIPSGVYNFGSENTYSTYQLMRCLMETINYDCSFIQAKEQEFMNLCMENKKIKNYGITFPETYDGLVIALNQAIV